LRQGNLVVQESGELLRDSLFRGWLSALLRFPAAFIHGEYPVNFAPGSKDFQTGGSAILLKGGDGLGVAAEKFFDGAGGLVAAPKLDDFWRLTIEGDRVGKVGVLGHQDKGVGFGVLPKDLAVGLSQAKQANLAGAGEEVGQRLTEFETEVLVEQQLHAAVRRRRSRSAA
jgi:hypothetical protein